MANINAFYRNANAVSYATQLFSGSAMTNGSTASTPSASQRFAARDNGGTPNSGAAERALSRIIEILTLGTADQNDAASVTEQVGYITAASGTKGDDTIDLKGRAVYKVATGAGNDTINAKTDTVAGLDAGEGDDRINLAARYITDVTGGAGSDTIQTTGKLVVGVDGGAGNDTLKISAATIIGVTGGEGDDTIYLEGTRISASGGRGNDTVTFHQKGNAKAEYIYARGDGADTINSDGPLSLRFGPADGYAPKDMQITLTGNSLTIAFGESKDKITVNFEEGALNGTKPAYAFSMDKGAYVLKIS